MGGNGLLRTVATKFVDIVSGLLLAVLFVCVIARYAFGVHAFCVLTGSMRPDLEVGDLVMVMPTDYDDIRVGDVVTYVLNEDLDVATHRVAEKNSAERTLVTKGDANEMVDATPVDARNVVGTVRVKVPRVGHVLRLLSSVPGKVAAVGVIVALMLLGALIRMVSASHDAGGQRAARPDEPEDGGRSAGAEASRLADMKLDELDRLAEAAGHAAREKVLATRGSVYHPTRVGADGRHGSSVMELSDGSVSDDRFGFFLDGVVRGDEYDASNYGAVLS